MIDLHCHTNISDSSLSIYEVISQAKKKGVSQLAITDHDTTKGLDEAVDIGKKLGVTIIPGIEMSAYDFTSKRRAHILGFFIESGHPAIEALCQPMIERRHQASYDAVERLIHAGYNITCEQVKTIAQHGTCVYKQHIMNALIDNGYGDVYFGDLYKRLFKKESKTGSLGIAYVPVKYIDAIDAIKAIRAAGGIPVLAHPKLYDNFAQIPKWVDEGLEGIEMRHPSHTKEDERRIEEMARNFDLIVTGGSDYHGVYTDHPYGIGSKSISIEHLEALEKRKELLFVQSGSGK